LKYALVTPVHNEERFIREMILSVMTQNPRPDKWIIIDDGSTDRTREIIEGFQNIDILQVVHLPPKHRRAPGGEGVIGHALRCLNITDYDFLARFDADIVLDDNYISNILEEFRRAPSLGIAGGGLYVLTSNGQHLEKQPQCHVRGALKMYRRECFEDIGGIEHYIGWDTLDETRAWIKGWTTRSFPQYRAIHRRPTGAGLSLARHSWQLGKADYMNWAHPLFVTLKAAKFHPLKGGAFLSGFISCYVMRVERVADKRVKLYRRRYQRARLLHFLSYLR
jgi:poly-beta-1,6-N-acetyl-D-glucosamine synthase